MENNLFSEVVSVFHERTTPEEGYIVGYAALINRYGLQVPTRYAINHTPQTQAIPNR